MRRVENRGIGIHDEQLAVGHSLGKIASGEEFRTDVCTEFPHRTDRLRTRGEAQNLSGRLVFLGAAAKDPNAAGRLRGSLRLVRWANFRWRRVFRGGRVGG